jgi:hypothetical protein
MLVMSGVFMDGGGGGEGGGVDHGHDHGDHGHERGHDMGGHPDQSPIWSQAMQGLKLNDFISSIKITPNHLLLFMFMGFTGWLGVIYWIRHHEPMANHLLGSGPAYTGSHVDRLLLDGAREALPVKTTPGSGRVYTPGSMPTSFNSAAPAPNPNLNQMPVSSVRFSTPHQVLPMTNGSGSAARLFSNRDQVGPGGQTGVRSGPLPGRSSRHEIGNLNISPIDGRTQYPTAGGRSEQFAASAPLAQPAPASQPGWSLAKDGFSSESAHYDARFGSPVDAGK